MYIPTLLSSHVQNKRVATSMRGNVKNGLQETLGMRYDFFIHFTACITDVEQRCKNEV